VTPPVLVRDVDAVWAEAQLRLPAALRAIPLTASDPMSDGTWPAPAPEVRFHLARRALEEPWGLHLVLAAFVLAARRLQPNTLIGYIGNLHTTFRELFGEAGLASMDDWNPDLLIPAYQDGELLPTHSQGRRTLFWGHYSSLANHGRRWLEALPADLQSAYRPYVLRMPDPFVVNGRSKQIEVLRRQQATRKAEVAAIVPYLMQIRAQAHFRFNRMERFRTAFHAARKEVEQHGRDVLPLAFSYEEGTASSKAMPRQRLHFRLWDREAFLETHPEADSRGRGRSRLRIHTSAATRQRLLVELVRVESLRPGVEPDSFWFLELLERDLLGSRPLQGRREERAAKQAWLRSWGYGDDTQSRHSSPFATGLRGILAWPAEDALFSRLAARHGVTLIPVEALYVGAVFGVLAVDIFTTTAMRMNEALQIRIEPDCFLEVAIPAPPKAADQHKRTAWVFRLIPKGEREEQPQNYRVDDQVRHQIAKTTWYLAVDHYHLKDSELLPKVPYARGVREHRFDNGRYLFQHGRRALTNMDLNACMRFLLHGMVFIKDNGEPVAITSHRLRHVVATYLLQVEEVPIDIVAEILKHKHLATTAYYAKATPAMVGERLEGYLARFAGVIDLEHDILRTPEEVQAQIEEARERMGSLLDVAGGTCTQPGYCPVKTACIGCPLNAPDPAKRHDPERSRFWATRERDRAVSEGRPMDARRMEQTIHECDVMLQEMDLIQTWREDELREAHVELSRDS
jgi:hypothetical protein